MRVLIAEDSAAARRVLEATVVRLGHECTVAEDGFRAWELFQRDGADVVISDWLMPGMDGDELCRRVRAADVPYVYFFLCTSLDDMDHVQRGMEAGADDYLIKPLDREELAARLVAASRVIGLHRRLAEQQRELERLNDELHGQARSDPLTGLGNRLRLEEDLGSLDGRFERYGDTYALVLLDVDHFKAYNDAFGHAAGDDLLIAVADAIRDTARRGDVVYRWGGDELVVVLAQQDLELAEIAAERIRGAVEALAIEHAPGAGASIVTVSIGVAARRGTGSGGEDVLRAADRALYAAKGAGRNRAIAA